MYIWDYLFSRGYLPSPKSVRYSVNTQWASASTLSNSANLRQASLAFMLDETVNPMGLLSSLKIVTVTSCHQAKKYT